MMDYENARFHMVESQIRTSDVTNYALVKAFRSVPREVFTPKAQMAVSYADLHIVTDEKRFILRPRDFAKLVQALDIQPTDIVLDIACGRGYSTAIMAALADTVVGLDTQQDVVDKATTNLLEAKVDNAAIVVGDFERGTPEHGPFNAIFVNGAMPAVPQAWLDLLVEGGRIGAFLPVGGVTRACIVRKINGTMNTQIVFDAHVPELVEFKSEPAFSF